MYSDLKIGTFYLIKYYDHFSSDNKAYQEAIFTDDTIMQTVGKYIGYNPKHVVISWNFCDDNQSDNDNMHILKNCIISIKELICKA